MSLKFVSKNLIDNKSALVEAMVGAKQVISHYLNQRSMSPYGLFHNDDFSLSVKKDQE